MIDQTLPPDDPFPEEGDFEARYAWFERRLSGSSREDCTLIAARAALRALPNLSFVLPRKINGKKARDAAKDIVLPLTRCHVLSAAFPLAPAAERTAFRNAAADGAGAARAARAAAYAADAAYAAAYAADAAAAAAAADARVRQADKLIEFLSFAPVAEAAIA